MIQDIYPKKFDIDYKNETPKKDDYVFFFAGHDRRDDKILVKDMGDFIQFPTVADIEENTSQENLQFLFAIDDASFFLVSADELTIGSYTLEPIKIMRKANPQDICFAGMAAYHLYSWYRDNKHCGRCGEKVEHLENMRALKCNHCGNTIFPRIAPAVIVGLRNGDSIMMSRYNGREYKGRALLAGFCEVGETAEETVAREVFEEVGLKVKNISYFASQPWGFDLNLLLGYFCDLDGDDNITLDTEELATAGFVKREDIETDNDIISLTATMIEAFRTGKDK